jgi:hypothetical protein
VNIMGATANNDYFNHQDEYDLAPTRMMRVQRARGWAVYCESGELLLTQEGDGRDFVLKAGDRVIINTHGRVLVEATCGSRLRLLQADAARASSSPGRPVVRVLPQRATAALNRHAGQCAALGPLTYERVFRRPRLVEQLVGRAHRERNALLAACAMAVMAGGMHFMAAAARASLAAVRSLLGAAAGLRPQLPSLQETFSALVFLRSRL